MRHRRRFGIELLLIEDGEVRFGGGAEEEGHGDKYSIG